MPVIHRSRSLNHSKMAEIQTSEVGAKLTPVNVRPWNFVYWWIFKGRTKSSGAIFVGVGWGEDTNVEAVEI
jgi:hypothetical protein